jgi:hypothetical protein
LEVKAQAAFETLLSHRQEPQEVDVDIRNALPEGAHDSSTEKRISRTAVVDWDAFRRRPPIAFVES